MQQNEFLANDPLAALKITPMALQGNSQSINTGNPMTELATNVGMSLATGGTFMGFKPFYSGTTSVPQNYMAGTDEVPGQRTGQDTVPAMLSPGEAVIPASAAQDPANQGAIEGMVQEGREDQGMAAQILQAVGMPADPQIIAMIEDMLAKGMPPEMIIEQLKELMGQAGDQGMPQEAPMAPPQAPMDAPMQSMDAPMQGMGQDMGMPQGLYGGTSDVSKYRQASPFMTGSMGDDASAYTQQLPFMTGSMGDDASAYTQQLPFMTGGPLSGKKQREQQKFDSDEYRKDAAFQSDQQRKNEMHSRKMNGE